MKSLLLLLIAGTMSLSASASNWVYIGATSEFEEYVDTESISIEGDYRTAFFKDKFFEDQLVSYSDPYNVSISFTKFDCSSNPKKSKFLSYVDKKGYEVVASGNVESSTKWQIAYPDTMGEATAKFVCSY